jgi:hypothetical protein
MYHHVATILDGYGAWILASGCWSVVESGSPPSFQVSHGYLIGIKVHKKAITKGKHA